jgi:hypothetical protein
MGARIIQVWKGMSIARKIVAIFALVLLVAGIWAASPLFYNRRVDEAFPAAAPQATAAMEAMPAKPAATTAAMEAMPAKPAATTAAMEAMPAATAAMEAMPAKPAATTAAMEAMPAATAAPVGPVALSSGSFTRVDAIHAAEGTATIYRLEDGKLVLRLENFKSTNGPDLFVGLSGHPMPRSKSEVHDQGYVQIAPLKGNQGNQNYELPADIDLSAFKSVVIYCRAFNVVFSTAELKGL